MRYIAQFSHHARVLLRGLSLSWALSGALSGALSVSGACALSVVPSVALAEGFVYVDLQRAVFEVKDGKAAKGRLEAMKADRQKALDAKQEELKKLQESFEKQMELLAPDVKEKKAEEFRVKLGELQQTYAKLQRELAEEEMKIQQEILGRMGALLEQMGSESDYSMIVRKDALLWAPPHLDITNEVIRRYDALSGGAPSPEGKPKKGAPAPKKGK
jgi:outer membrane protein